MTPIDFDRPYPPYPGPDLAGGFEQGFGIDGLGADGESVGHVRTLPEPFLETAHPFKVTPNGNNNVTIAKGRILFNESPEVGGWFDVAEQDVTVNNSGYIYLDLALGAYGTSTAIFQLETGSPSRTGTVQWKGLLLDTAAPTPAGYFTTTTPVPATTTGTLYDTNQMQIPLAQVTNTGGVITVDEQIVVDNIYMFHWNVMDAYQTTS